MVMQLDAVGTRGDLLADAQLIFTLLLVYRDVDETIVESERGLAVHFREDDERIPPGWTWLTQLTPKNQRFFAVDLCPWNELLQARVVSVEAPAAPSVSDEDILRVFEGFVEDWRVTARIDKSPLLRELPKENDEFEEVPDLDRLR